ncbi:MAG: hypothetical protein Q9209_001178 [Squamulea sp. 1 TL-2023]
MLQFEECSLLTKRIAGVKSSHIKAIFHSATSPQRKSETNQVHQATTGQVAETSVSSTVYHHTTPAPAIDRRRTIAATQSTTAFWTVEMTNQLVGAVYGKIIDELIKQAAVSFEEDGVNHSVLDELKKTWQHRLTNTKCASFPWDPPPVPPVPQPMVNPAPVPSNAPRPPQVSSSGSPALSSTSNSSNTVQVKEESPYMNHGLPSGIQPSYSSPIAQQRAAQNLQQKFGPTANPQINQLHAQAAMSHQGHQQHQSTPQNIQLPQMTEQHRQYMEQQHQRRQQLQQMQQAQQRPQVHTAPVSSAQTDGVGEWNSFIAQRRAAALADPDSVYSTDLTIRQQLEQSSRVMEGGGLMLPLSEQPNRLPAQKQKSNTNLRVKASQFDGTNDSDEDAKGVKHEDLGDEEDEDAINSDLDDPDDDVVEEEGEDSNQGQIMLCTYDKVQRVKNKWKCILKDGVLTTGGKE